MIYYEYWHSLGAIVHRPPPYGRLGMTAFSWPVKPAASLYPPTHTRARAHTLRVVCKP